MHSDKNRSDIRTFVEARLAHAVMQRSRDTSTGAGLTQVLARRELQELLGEDEMERLRRAPVSGVAPLAAATAAAVCRRAAECSCTREVLRQLEVDPMLDLNKLPEKLAGLYMRRYEMTFPDGDAMAGPV